MAKSAKLIGFLCLFLGFMTYFTPATSLTTMKSLNTKTLAIKGGEKLEYHCEGNTCTLKTRKHKQSKKSKKRKKNQLHSNGNFQGFLKLQELKFKRSFQTFSRIITAFWKQIPSFMKNTSPASKLSTKSSSLKSSKLAQTKKSSIKSNSLDRLTRRRGNTRTSTVLRIQRELHDFQTNPPDNCIVTVREDNMNIWIITLTGVKGTLFEGEQHKLRIEFPKEYPSKPPSVYFLKPTPRHPHVYTNGDICLDLLGTGWKPQITIRTLAISILSILSSCKEKGVPPDNCNHAENAPGQTQQGWLYHDDHC